MHINFLGMMIPNSKPVFCLKMVNKGHTHRHTQNGQQTIFPGFFKNGVFVQKNVETMPQVKHLAWEAMCFNRLMAVRAQELRALRRKVRLQAFGSGAESRKWQFERDHFLNPWVEAVLSLFYFSRLFFCFSTGFLYSKYR